LISPRANDCCPFGAIGVGDPAGLPAGICEACAGLRPTCARHTKRIRTPRATLALSIARCELAISFQSLFSSASLHRSVPGSPAPPTQGGFSLGFLAHARSVLSARPIPTDILSVPTVRNDIGTRPALPERRPTMLRQAGGKGRRSLRRRGLRPGVCDAPKSARWSEGDY